MSTYSKQEMRSLFHVMRDYTSLQTAQDTFLRPLGLPFSASSWGDAIERRFLPAFWEEPQLDPLQALKFLRTREEYGAQHVFLYRCGSPNVNSYLTKSSLRALLSNRDSKTLTHPRVVDLPTRPQVADIRLGQGSFGASLTLNVTETRVYRRYGDEKEVNGTLVKSFHFEKVRAVNVCRLHANGLLELRLQSHPYWYASESYEDVRKRIRAKIFRVLPGLACTTLPLSRAKNKIWHHRAKFANEVKFLRAECSNPPGSTLIVAAGTTHSDLANDPGATTSLDDFLAKSGVCEDWSLRWHTPLELAAGEGTVVCLSGEINQFSVDSTSSEAAYEHILKAIYNLC